MLGQLTAFFEGHDDDVLAAYVFGSVARGTSHARSDTDIAILLRHDPAPTFASLALRLEGELEVALGASVQIVVLNRAPVDLVHRILRDGQIVIDRDRPARLRFEVKARAEYLDLVPFLQQYRKGAPRRGRGVDP